MPQLLRHPNGAAVIDDAYTAAYPAQRNAMAAEFYGKEFTLFEVGCEMVALQPFCPIQGHLACTA